MISKGRIFLFLIGITILVFTIYMCCKKDNKQSKAQIVVVTTNKQPEKQYDVSLAKFRDQIGLWKIAGKLDEKMIDEHLKNIENIYSFVINNDEVIRGLLHDAQFYSQNNTTGESNSNGSNTNKPNEIPLSYFPGHEVDIEGFKQYSKNFIDFLNGIKQKNELENQFIEVKSYLSELYKGSWIKKFKVASLVKDLIQHNVVPTDFLTTTHDHKDKNRSFVCIISSLYHLAVNFSRRI